MMKYEKLVEALRALPCKRDPYCGADSGCIADVAAEAIEELAAECEAWKRLHNTTAEAARGVAE